MTNTLTRGATARLISLDVFRGITIAGMVLVNNPGSWGHIYLKLIKRTLIIFTLGLFLNGFPYFDLSTIRIPGVLSHTAAFSPESKASYSTWNRFNGSL